MKRTSGCRVWTGHCIWCKGRVRGRLVRAREFMHIVDAAGYEHEVTNLEATNAFAECRSPGVECRKRREEKNADRAGNPN